MGVGTVLRATDDVPEQFFTQCLQQIVLSLEVVVERGPSDVGRVYDLLHGDFPVALFRQEGAERAKNGRSCFLLPSIHSNAPSRTVWQKRSTPNSTAILSVVSLSCLVYNKREQTVCYKMYCTESAPDCQAQNAIRTGGNEHDKKGE